MLSTVLNMDYADPLNRSAPFQPVGAGLPISISTPIVCVK